MRPATPYSFHLSVMPVVESLESLLRRWSRGVGLAIAVLLRTVTSSYHPGVVERYSPSDLVQLAFHMRVPARVLLQARYGTILADHPEGVPGWRFAGATAVCPVCVSQSNGVFRQRWRLLTSFVCVEHRVYLVDRCAAGHLIGHQRHRGKSPWAKHPWWTGPADACGAWVQARPFCMLPTASLPRSEADADAVALQRQLDAVTAFPWGGDTAAWLATYRQVLRRLEGLPAESSLRKQHIGAARRALTLTPRADDTTAEVTRRLDAASTDELHALVDVVRHGYGTTTLHTGIVERGLFQPRSEVNEPTVALAEVLG